MIDPHRTDASTPDPATTRHVGVAVTVATFVLMVAWGLMLPLFAGPDETSNFIKSAAVIRGELVGADHPPTADDSYFRTTVDIDRQFNAANWIPWCFAPTPANPACDRPLATTDPRDARTWTSVGRYPPAAFVVPGIATLGGPTDRAARLARLVNAAAVSVLVGLAAGRLTRSALPTTTVLVALTPGVFFLGAVLSPSGVEIAAAFATWVFAGAALSGKRWGRPDELAFAVSAGVLVLTRPIGAVLLLCILAITALAVGVRPTVMLVIARHRLTVIVSAVTAAFMAFWHLQVFSVHLGQSVVAGDPSIGAIGVTKRGLRHLPELLEQHVGNFGWLDTPSPTVVVWFFVSVTGIVVTTAWTSLTLRERIAIPTLIVVTIALSLYLDADYYRLFRNFGAQGRHLSPLLIGVPVLVARGWRPSTRTNVAVATGWFLAMSWCAVEALRRYSVGDGGIWDMFTAPVWTPWLGVVPSLILVIAAAAAVAVMSVGRPTRAHRSPDVQRSPHGDTGTVHEHDDDAALGER